MIESTQKTRKLKIKSMGGNFATGGFFVASGAKILPNDICTVPEDVAKAAEDSDLVELTTKTANCKLIANGSKWVIERD